jgi:hypothetical protein
MMDFDVSGLLLQDLIMEQPPDEYSTSPSNSAVINTPPSGDDLSMYDLSMYDLSMYDPSIYDPSIYDLSIYDSLDPISPEEMVSDPDQISSLADRMLNVEENFADSTGHLLDELAGQNPILRHAEPGGFNLGAEHQVNAFPCVNNAEPSYLGYHNNALRGSPEPQSIENEVIPPILPQVRIAKKKRALKDPVSMAFEQAKAVAEKERLIQEAIMRKEAVEEGQCFGISTTRGQNGKDSYVLRHVFLADLGTESINWTPATVYSMHPNHIQGARPTFTNPLRIPQTSNNNSEVYATISGNQTHWTSSAQTQYLQNGVLTSPQLSLPSTYQFAQRLQTDYEIGQGGNMA